LKCNPPLLAIIVIAANLANIPLCCAEEESSGVYSSAYFSGLNMPASEWLAWQMKLDQAIKDEFYKAAPVDLGGSQFDPLRSVVLFTVTRDGKIKNIQLRSKSGDPRCDRVAIAAVKAAEKRIQPFPVHQAGTDAVFKIRLMYPESAELVPYYFFQDNSISPRYIHRSP
jgi:TonB family protein